MHDTPLLDYISLTTIPSSKTTPSWSRVRKRTDSRGIAPNQRFLPEPTVPAVLINAIHYRIQRSLRDVGEQNRFDRGAVPLISSTSYGLKPTVLISAMRHGQRSFRDMCRMPAVAKGHVPGWPEPNTPQRSLRDMCGIPQRWFSAELFRRTPRKIKFLVKFLSPLVDSNPRPS